MIWLLCSSSAVSPAGGQHAGEGPTSAGGGAEKEQRVPQVGDLVFVPKLQKRASVVKVKNKGKALELKVGSLKVSALVGEVEIV